MSRDRIPDHLKDIVGAAANLGGGGGPSDPHQVSAARAQRYAMMDFAASVSSTTGITPDGVPAVFISQRSHKTDLVESDVVLNMRQAVVAFCQLMAFSVGLNVAFSPIVPPQNPSHPNGNPT